MTLFGVMYSMKNSRMLITNKATGKTVPIMKSDRQLAFKNFIIQAKSQWNNLPPLPEPVSLKATIFYPSKRSDLDDAMLMDVIEKSGIVQNDRHIWHKIITKAISRDNPRVEFDVSPIE